MAEIWRQKNDRGRRVEGWKPYRFLTDLTGHGRSSASRLVFIGRGDQKITRIYSDLLGFTRMSSVGVGFRLGDGLFAKAAAEEGVESGGFH